MEKCSRCKISETILYINGEPICVDCDNKAQQSVRPPTDEMLTRKGPVKVESIDRTTGGSIHIVGDKRR